MDDCDHVFCKRIGHLSLCAVHLSICMFLFTGNAQLFEELPKKDYDPPEDFYGRPLKKFWFKFVAPPVNETEKIFLEYLESLVSTQSEPHKRLMSPFPVSNVTDENPLLSLNALLVVTGFCHVFTKFSPDKLLLGLQKIAWESKIGPIWCGASRNFYLWMYFWKQCRFHLKTLQPCNNVKFGEVRISF